MHVDSVLAYTLSTKANTCVRVEHRLAWLQGSMASAPMVLGDRTNKIASSRPIPSAVYQQQAKGNTSSKDLRSSRPAGTDAVPAGTGPDQNRDEDQVTDMLLASQMGTSSVRLEAQASGCNQQGDINICALAEAQSLADPLSSNIGSVHHEADTAMQLMSVSGDLHIQENSAQESQLGHSPDKLEGGSAVQKAVFGIAAANNSSTGNAVEAVTVSPGRRIYAAQVTVTRPTTPASPASTYQ